MVTQFSAFSVKGFYCELCDLRCSKKNDYARHILTQKHKGNSEGNKKSAKTHFACEICKKEYKSRKGLWGHNKICTFENKNTNENENKNENKNTNENSVINDASNNIIQLLIKENSEFKNIVLELVKSNTKLQEQMLEVCKNNHPASIINSNNTNSHNKTFNLHFFLNEQCKDAMNLKDFVNSFQLKLEDLERVGEQGYAEGISHIIIEKLKETDIYKRPIHCSDARRDTLYVKADDVWGKEGPDNDKMTIAVKDIGKKNFMLLNEYRELHPDCLNSDSDYNDHYAKLIMHAAGGGIKENVSKVIKKVAREVVIEKE